MSPRWLARFICSIPFIFHDLEVVQEFGGSRKLYCRRCCGYFGMHDGVRAFLPWDDELEELYRVTHGISRTNK